MTLTRTVLLSLGFPALFFTEPMRTPKRLKIAKTMSRLIAVDWESLGYNITRCHTFNVTICYQYMTANNVSKADCLDMDPKGKSHSVNLLLLHNPLTLSYTYTINAIVDGCKPKQKLHFDLV